MIERQAKLESHFHEGVGVVLLVVGACSLTVDADQIQCDRDEDCTAITLETECINSICVEKEVTDERFGCRNETLAEPSSTMVGYSMTAINLIGQDAFEGLTVKVCPQFDVDCADPATEAVTNSAGLFTVQLPEGFRGHLFAPPTAAQPELVPRIIQVFPPPGVGGNVGTGSILFVTTLQTIGGLAQLAGEQVVPGTGHVFFTANDCSGAPMQGVSVSTASTQAETFVTYIGGNGQLDPSLISTGPIGQGAILNVPLGFISIRGVHEDEGKIYEQSTIVAADTVTSISTIVPSPTP